MNRYVDYSRRKKIPFRNAVEQGEFEENIISCYCNLFDNFSAYKFVLHDYGLDSNNGSEGESDLEVMDVRQIFSLSYQIINMRFFCS
jgi:hypothetical protein